uniref:AT1G17665-like protein n=1 Tax=Pelargonium hortorum TaxID=4031 RepID=A0A0G4AQ21_PELHO|nr:AT1G17665-like protein [Pelargonium x hortorum]
MFSIIFCFFSLFLSLSSFCFVSFYLYKKRLLLKTELERELDRTDDPIDLNQSLSRIVEKSRTQLTHSLLLEIVGDAKGLDCGDCVEEERAKKKKKRRAKKKKGDLNLNSEGGGSGLESGNRVKEELVCLYPFTSSSSATQRKIKQQYDQLVKCHESTKGLTLAQVVGQFANCLIEAKNELKQKSETIQRKYTITKALLNKAERSSFDRLRQQIYRLELEQKRLEDDTFVYNWLQQQLKLSPAYKKMLEIGADMELKAKTSELTESTDTEFDDISFEELLAKEKKDSFWMKNGRRRSCSS